LTVNSHLSLHDALPIYYDLIYHALVNYEGDVDFLEEVFRRYTVKPGTILDLGCGTGNHSVPLARRGYRVTGIDRSASMIAQAKRSEEHTSELQSRFDLV